MELSDDEIEDYVQQGGKLTAIGNKIYVMFKDTDAEDGADTVDKGNPDHYSLIYEKIHDLYDCLIEQAKWTGVPLLNASTLFNFEEFLKTSRRN